MYFDDSFFEDSVADGCERREECNKRKIDYTAKRCEPEWFVAEKPSDTVCGGCYDDPVEDFMLLKYRADLLYHRKQFAEALTYYTQILEVLPKSNTVVRREVEDSITRCCLHTQDYSKALETARLLVLPPHDKDSSSWRLLAQCFQQLGECEEQLLALQKCAALQRHHPPYWIALAEAYRCFNSILRKTESDRDSDCERLVILSQVESILSNTVSLFRPYFRWNLRNSCGSKSGAFPNLKTPSSKLVRLDDDSPADSEADSRKLRSTCTWLPPHKPASYSGPKKTAGISLGDGVDSGMGLDQVEMSAKMVCVSPCEGLKCETRAPVSSSNGFIQVKSGTNSRGGTLESDVTNSPFVVLVSGKTSIQSFLEQFEQLSKETARQVLSSFCETASCSSLIWARQLLLYSVRYSTSFAREAQQVQLKRVEQLLDRCHGNTKHFLLEHFCLISVFDTSISATGED